MSGVAGLRHECREELEALVRENLGVDAAAIVTGDGFEVAAVLRDHMTGERLAAMSSALLALSEAVVRELDMGGCRNVIIEGKNGTVVTMRVPVPDRELVMSVICSNAASLGAVLFASRRTAANLGTRLPAAG